MKFFIIFIFEMDIVLILILIITLLGLPAIIFYEKRKSRMPAGTLQMNYRALLNKEVDFYKELDHSKKAEFDSRVQLFLERVKITGVRTTVEDLDRILIAAGAIIPIFGFPDWEYINLNEVLLYPDAFDEEFKLEGKKLNILGMVGNGALQNIMILSKQQLRYGFENMEGKENTAIHEFVHLIDKTDGAVDGLPEFMLSKNLTLPWLALIHEAIKQITQNRSDINPYGATNPAEFFAVVAEYFFKRPRLLQSKHPELYEILVTMFKQKPGLTKRDDHPPDPA